MLVDQPHEYLVPAPPTDPYIFQATVYSAGASLALVAWDVLLTLGDEVKHIWPKPGRTCVKWIYLFSRWFGLLNQVIIQIWHTSLAACLPAPISTCAGFFIFESITFQLLQLSLDTIMILRIRAVYRQNRLYITAAITLVLFEVLTTVIAQATSVPKSVVAGTCILLYTPKTASSIGISITISQTLLLLLTYRGKLLMQPAARRSRIINVVVRDGMLGFAAVIGIVLIPVIYVRFNEVIINVFFPWMPVISSVLAPRMILNMQTAVEPPGSILELTTDLGAAPDSEI